MKLTIDYEGLATNPAGAMRRVVTLFTRAGLDVIDVGSDGKTKRIAGVSYREVTLTFADSQRLGLRIKATGDVYEVRINGKVTPVKAQDDAAKAVTELVRMLDKGRGRFQKRMAALAMKPPEGAKTAAPKLRDALTAQIAQVDAEIADATQELEALQAA
jgi:hypothetical protein